MKNNYKLLLIALVAMLSFASCKKDGKAEKSTEDIGKDLEISAGGKTYLVSKLTYDKDEYETYEYDTKGRLTKSTYFWKGNSDRYNTITYNGNKVTRTSFYKGKEESKEEYTLGANGYASDVAYTQSYEDNGFITTYSYTDKLSHNKDGQVTKIVSTSVQSSTNPIVPKTTDTYTIDLTYSDGNLKTEVETYLDNNGLTSTSTKSYEYYTDKNSSPALYIEELDFLLTKPSKNLVKKRTYTSGTENIVKNYIYTFNSDKLVETFKDDNSPDYVTEVTYRVK